MLLALADLPTPAGRTFIVKMLVEAGTNNLYQNQTDTDGSLLDGDDIFAGTQALTRVRWADPVLVLNDNPSGESLADVFLAGGAAADSRFHLQTDDGAQAFDIADVTLDTAGENFARWSGLPLAWITLVGGIATGDRFILGISVASAAVDRTGDADPLAGEGSFNEPAGFATAPTTDGVSFFDSAVVGDFDDSEATDSTPGCVLTFRAFCR